MHGENHRTRTLLRAVVTVAALIPSGILFDEGRTIAAEIKVISSPGVRGVLGELAPQFQRATGHKVVMDFAVIAVLRRRIEAGEMFDIVIPDPTLIDELVKQGKVAAETAASFGRTGLGLGVRKGMPKPDISSADKLKDALLSAKAVGHSKEGQSGVNFLEVLDRLGIAQGMRPKLKTYEGNGMAVAIEAGEVDMVVTGIGPLLEMRAADFVGGLPPGIQRYVKFSIGVSAAGQDPEAARAFVRFLASPAATPVFNARGLERD